MIKNDGLENQNMEIRGLTLVDVFVSLKVAIMSRCDLWSNTMRVQAKLKEHSCVAYTFHCNDQC